MWQNIKYVTTFLFIQYSHAANSDKRWLRNTETTKQRLMQTAVAPNHYELSRISSVTPPAPSASVTPLSSVPVAPLPSASVTSSPSASVTSPPSASVTSPPAWLSFRSPLSAVPINQRPIWRPIAIRADLASNLSGPGRAVAAGHPRRASLALHGRPAAPARFLPPESPAFIAPAAAVKGWTRAGAGGQYSPRTGRPLPLETGSEVREWIR